MNTRYIRRSLLILSLMTWVSACTLAPRYQQPAAPVPLAYEDDAASAGTAPLPAAEIGWH